ncbi:MAG TPA: hypothetical protein VHN99_10310 [Deinococcales bacterium]|nr:hypothetical protein [Deinococcales bacterium]
MTTLRAFLSPFNVIAAGLLVAVLVLQSLLGRPDAPINQLPREGGKPTTVTVALHYPTAALDRETAPNATVGLPSADTSLDAAATLVAARWLKGAQGGGATPRLLPVTATAPTIVVRYGTAYVNLPENWRGLGGGSEVEWWTVCGLANTLFGLQGPTPDGGEPPRIASVLYLIGGQAAGTLAGHVDLSQPFTPAVCKS